MPIIPEKRQLEDHVHGAIAAQFWSQGIENTRSLTGQTCTAPCEPQPLRLNAPSGLSRTQFLVAAHAVRVPVFPGFCDEHGGTVVDRVLLQSGGAQWWGALIGRAKVQRAVQQRSTTRLRRNLADPDNYALAATGRLQLSRSTRLKATLQVDNLQQLQPLLPQGGRIWHQQQQQRAGGPRGPASSGTAAAVNSTQQQQQQRGPSGGWSKVGQSSSLQLQLKQQLEGLDLTADLAVNEPSVEGVRRYCTTPLRLAVDLAPASSSKKGNKRLQGLLFRVGLHGVVAPVEGPGAAAAATGTEQQQQQQHALSVHCQGAIALTANKTVWEAAQKPWQAAAADAAAQHKQRQKQRARQQEQQQQLEVQPLQLDNAGGSNGGGGGGSNSSSAPATAAAVDDVPSSSGATAGSDHSAGSSSSSKHHHHHLHHHNHKRSSQHSSKGTSNSSSSRRGGGSSGSSSGKRYLTLHGTEIPLPLLSPGGVQEGLQDTSSRIERLRTDLRLWTNRVESGELQHIGQRSKPAGLLAKEPGSCWSSFLPGPHVKVSGLIGLLGRVPLQQQTLLQGSSTSQTHRLSSSSTASLASTTDGLAAGDDSTAAAAAAARPAVAASGKPLSHKARSFLAASATHLDRMVLGSAKKLGTSITQESTLRLFGSGGASMQLGEMRGNFFDYTRLEAVLDLGLNAPETSAAPAGAATAAGHGSSRRGTAAASGSGAAARQQQQHSRQQAGGSRLASSPLGRGMGSILGPAVAAELAAGMPASTGSSGALATTAAAAGPSQQAGSAAAAAPVAAAAAAAGGGGVGFKTSKHPAFALEDRCAWHALTLSATQQLVGPVRLRGDWRFALDSSHPCPRGSALLQPSGPLQLLRHVAGVSPALVDAAYGVDVVVPGAGGLVRLVGWWSPGRREGGLELRLM